jgi:hypothetical protein
MAFKNLRIVRAGVKGFLLMVTNSLALLLSFAFARQLPAAGASLEAPPPFFFLDLSRHVNIGFFDSQINTPGNNLGTLVGSTHATEPVVKVFRKIPFRMFRGIILVGPGSTGTDLNGMVEVPKQVEGIPVGRRAKRLHFLHATHFGNRTYTKIGAYIVQYADDRSVEIPIRYGEDLLDWWARSGEEPGQALSKIAWMGNNGAASAMGATSIRLFIKTWDNPHPELEITRISMVTGPQPSGKTAPAPFLVAVTGEGDADLPRPEAKLTPLSESDIVGKWESVNRSKEGIGTTMEFSADGSAAISMGAMVDSAYKLEGNVLSETFLDAETRKVSTRTSEIEVKGDTLTLKDTSSHSEQKMDRVSRGAPGDPPVVGKWSWNHPSGKVATSEFTKDGQLLVRLPLRTDKARYQLKGDSLILSFEKFEPQVKKIRVEKDLLIVSSTGGGLGQTYQRVRGSAEQVQK